LHPHRGCAVTENLTHSDLDNLAGRHLPGGCDDCDADQTVTQTSDGVYVLTVHHDDGCPFLSGVTA
jgi:hypothetical protein